MKKSGHEEFAATSIRQPSRRGGWNREDGPPVGSSTSAMPNVIGKMRLSLDKEVDDDTRTNNAARYKEEGKRLYNF